MSYVVFLPWVKVNETVEIGPLRLLPYVRGKKPGNLLHARQRDLDAVLRAYADPPKRAVTAATIVELAEFRTGMDEIDVGAIFHAKEILAYSALSKRRLFQRWWGYTNYDTYLLVAQRYNGGSAGTFSFHSRRRDGGTTHLWGARDFAFIRPSHVDAQAVLRVDHELANALFEAAPLGSRLHNSISEFNAANTDSPNVPEHVELAMMKSAFESLLKIGINRAALVAGLNQLVGSVLLDPQEGPLLDRWKARQGPNVLSAWAKEFSSIRGSSAHGQERIRSGGFVWSAAAHLAFASLLHPMLMRKALEDDCALASDKFERGRLEHVQSFLAHDPFAELDRKEEHPWAAVEDKAVSAARAEALYQAVSDAMDAASAASQQATPTARAETSG